MLNIYIGNKLNGLADILQKNISSKAAPLKKTTICIQTSGMQRWVGLALAERSGISANLDYLFPAALIKRMAERHTGRKDLWTEKQELTWKIFDELGSIPATEYNRPVIKYLENDPDSIKTFRLAGRIADIFDQYQLYRPEMTLRWLNSPHMDKDDEKWQANLFRSVFSAKSRCKTYVLDKMLRSMTEGKAELTGMTDIHVFGISVIPEFFIEILAQAAKFTNISFYLLSPTEEYWGDSVSDREISRREKRSGRPADELMLRQNHPLLDNLGTLGRDFFDILLSTADSAHYIENYSTPSSDSVLSAIQAEIFTLKQQPFTPETGDTSVTVASCHNPLRETEALYDHLLSLFDNDAALKPSDILVMTTDIQTYAPYIRAVFDNPYSAETAMPYTLADMPYKQTSRPAGIFIDLLDTVTGQFSLSSVMKLLSEEIVASKFGLTGNEDIGAVLERNSALFGLTDEELREDGVTSETPFTFEHAMRRIALGLAEGTSGYIYSEASGDDVPFSLAEKLGGVMRFTELCARYRKLLKRTVPAEEHCAVLTDIMNDFLNSSPAHADDLIYMTGLIEDINSQTSGLKKPVGFRPIYETLSGMLSEASGNKGFITGKITFCAMLPMRSIPFRVICILGLNDATFPRVKTALEFDLMAKHPKKGDRNQRDSDKYLFLETLISAQEKLYLSYIGRSETDNKEMVPSILITELLRHISGRFGIKEPVTQHRLHSFSRQYFTDDTGLCTYSPDRYTAACALTGAKTTGVFCPGSISSEPVISVDIASFERFFINPPEYFLRNTLGTDPNISAELLTETERMNLNHLQKYMLEDDALKCALRSGRPDISLRYAAASGRLPSGGLGEYYYENIAAAGAKMAKTAEKAMPEGTGYLDISAVIDGLSISGRVQNTLNGRHAYIKTGSLKPKDFIRAWIRHLMLNTQTETVTSVITKKGELRLKPLDPSEYLKALKKLFISGQSEPLYFHPSDGAELIKYRDKKLKFITKDNYSGIKNDMSFSICFKDREMPEELAKYSEIILGGCQEHVDE
ncbi:MAG: exodeoxyribonuclease V subunit gamma [Deferribacterales bacterium]